MVATGQVWGQCLEHSKHHRRFTIDAIWIGGEKDGEEKEAQFTFDGTGYKPRDSLLPSGALFSHSTSISGVSTMRQVLEIWQ